MLGLDRPMRCLSHVGRGRAHAGGKLSGNRGICHVMEPLQGVQETLKPVCRTAEPHANQPKKILRSDYGMVMP